MVNRRLTYYIAYLLGITTLFLVLFVVFNRYAIVFNTTDSYPFGFYQTQPIDRAIQRGDLVAFCLPTGDYTQLITDRGCIGEGSCDSGLTSLIKRVYGLAGDRVVISAEGVRVNGGELIEHSSPITHDRKGRPLPQMASGTVDKDHYAMFSEYHPLSFDSRYFGTIHRDNIHHFIKPLWIMGKINEYRQENP